MTKLVAVEGETKLDRFELVAELASGGMATVFLARLSGVGGFQRFVAIKRLHPHLAREQEFIQMFLDEARLAARIHHPNVVPILEIGESDRGYYLVMEYIEGDTLGRLLARSAQSQTKIPVAIGTRMILDALAGLHAAHELKDDDGKLLGLVHRDVSPQNILIGVDGNGRITDFGVARAGSRLSTTRTGQLKGKLAYMAPEQAKAAKDIDRRADIFAMGTVLWELLACKRLFKGDGEAETLSKVLHDPIPSLRSANPLIPAALEAVVSRALERDREKRYANAAEFADALERAARVVGALAAHREVAKYVEEVIGSEISQQREAVRAWLARSEPSRHPSVDKIMSSARDRASVTRVEGRRGSASEPSQPSSVSSAASVVAIPPEPVPSTSSLSATPPPSGSDVSRAHQPPARAPRRVWPWVAAVVVLAAAAFVGVRQYNLRAVSAAPPVETSVPIAAATTAPPPPATTAAAPPPPAPTPEQAPAAVASASAAPTARAHKAASVIPVRPVPAPTTTTTTAAAPTPTPAPSPTTPPAPPPDDISKNPYR